MDQEQAERLIVAIEKLVVQVADLKHVLALHGLATMETHHIAEQAAAEGAANALRDYIR